MDRSNKARIAAFAVLAGALALAVAALAGVSAANSGHDNGVSASAAEYQYGTSGGKQYGRNRVEICHKGHTIKVAQPAVAAHLRHGDTLGVCTAAPTTKSSTNGPTTPHGNSGGNGKGHSK